MDISISKALESRDTSIKYSLLTPENKIIEAIYFPFRGYLDRKFITAQVLCMSSQTGCPIKCEFCATGKIPLSRNLSSSELSSQYEAVKEDVSQRHGEPIDSVAMMGMGEPLLNLKNVLTFYNQVMKDETDLKRFSVSTVGLIPQLRQLQESDANIKLYLSVHAPDDASRSSIIPVNRKYPISSVVEETRKYTESRSKTVVANYVLMNGINDSKEQAEALAKLLDPDHFDIQLNMWNEIGGTDIKRSTMQKLQMFKDILENKGYTVDVQLSKGTDVGGGCGQLAGREG